MRLIPIWLADADEVKDRRSATMKWFDTGDKTPAWRPIYKVRLSSKLHYFNKTWVGDGQKRWREVDYTLNKWDSWWSFEYNSYQPTFPLKSTDWFEFRNLLEDADMTIKIKPIGETVDWVHSDEAVKDWPWVVYKDVFGTGMDYVLIPKTRGVTKMIRVAPEFKWDKDLRFKMELDIWDYKLFRGKGEKISYEIRQEWAKTLDTFKDTFIYDPEAKTYTKFKPMQAWDEWDVMNRVNIATIISFENGKVYLEKIIPAEFIAICKGNVCTDVTVVDYDAHAAWDWWHRMRAPFSWGYPNYFNTLHDWDWVSWDYSSIYEWADTMLTWLSSDGNPPPWPYCYMTRSFLLFDTTGLWASFSVISWNMELYLESQTSTSHASTESWDQIVWPSTQASTSEIVDADWNKHAQIDPTVPTMTDKRWNINWSWDWDTPTVSDWNISALNAAWITNIVKEWITRYSIRCGNDIEDTAIVVSTWGKATRNSWYSWDKATFEPVLELTLSDHPIDENTDITIGSEKSVTIEREVGNSSLAVSTDSTPAWHYPKDTVIGISDELLPIWPTSTTKADQVFDRAEDTAKNILTE